MITAASSAVGWSVWLGIVFLFSELSNNSGEIPKLGHAPSSLLGAQARRGYDVHELGALKNECLERRNLLKLSGRVSKLLDQLGATLELGERDLQSKLPEMLPLLKPGSASRGSQSAPDADSRAEQSRASGNGGNKDNLTHIIVAGLVGFMSAICGDLDGVWITLRLTMPNK